MNRMLMPRGYVESRGPAARHPELPHRLYVLSLQEQELRDLLGKMFPEPQHTHYQLEGPSPAIWDEDYWGE